MAPQVLEGEPPALWIAATPSGASTREAVERVAAFAAADTARWDSLMRASAEVVHGAVDALSAPTPDLETLGRLLDDEEEQEDPR